MPVRLAQAYLTSKIFDVFHDECHDFFVVQNEEVRMMSRHPDNPTHAFHIDLPVV